MALDVKSSFFTTETEKLGSGKPNSISEEYLEIVDELNDSLREFNLPAAVKCVYNPTIYARQTFEMYVRKYCNTKKSIMFFGMNPGPWGMSQTGVPFGEISSVRDWLGIEGPVSKPCNEIRERPVNGFACTRTEVSEMEGLYNICDPILVKVLKLYEVEIVVAIGKFCETRAQKALKKYMPCNNIKILYLSHPSPRTVNNNNWDQKALEQLTAHDLLKYYKK
nr:single-strand selective monofunctional uracil DNA glycosylase isoform X2 [Vanessa tameamea]